MNRSVLVIGLGRFGTATALMLDLSLSGGYPYHRIA